MSFVLCVQVFIAPRPINVSLYFVRTIRPESQSSCEVARLVDVCYLHIEHESIFDSVQKERQLQFRMFFFAFYSAFYFVVPCSISSISLFHQTRGFHLIATAYYLVQQHSYAKRETYFAPNAYIVVVCHCYDKMLFCFLDF